MSLNSEKWFQSACANIGKYTLKGKSWKVNQIVSNGNFESKSSWSFYNENTNATYSSNNELEINILVNSPALIGFYATTLNNSLVLGHKYIYSFNVFSTISIQRIGYCGLNDKSEYIYFDTLENKWSNYIEFITCNNEQFRPQMLITNRTNLRVNDKIKVKNFYAIDLTEAFGAGNEPSTIDEFYSTDLGKYVKAKGYIDYTQGAIKSIESPFYFSEGYYNQLVQNGNFESKSGWSAQNGTLRVANNIATLTYTSGSFPGISRIIDGQVGNKYLVICDFKGATRVNCNWNGFNGLIEDNLNASEWNKISKIITAVSIQNLFQLFVYNETVIEIYFKNVNIIDLTKAFGAGNEPSTIEAFYQTNVGKLITKYGYLPYSQQNTLFKPRSYSLHNIKLNGIDDIKDTWKNWTGKVNRKLGSVDLGTLSWSRNEYSGIYCFVSDQIQQVKTSSNNYLCHKYITINNNIPVAYMNNLDIKKGASSNNFFIRDDSYSDKTTFKSAMNGVMLIYEKDTSSIESLNSLMLPKGITTIIDKNGMEVEFENN